MCINAKSEAKDDITWLEKKVCLEPDLNREPIIPYDKSILCVTSRMEVLSFEISGFSWVLESKFLKEKETKFQLLMV